MGGGQDRRPWWTVIVPGLHRTVSLPAWTPEEALYICGYPVDLQNPDLERHPGGGLCAVFGGRTVVVQPKKASTPVRSTGRREG